MTRQVDSKQIQILLGVSKAEQRLRLKDQLEAMDFNVIPAHDQQSINGLLSNRTFDLMILVHDPEGLDVISLMEKELSSERRLRWIVLSEKPEVQDAVLCMKLGALDFVCDPWKPEVLGHAIERALATKVPMLEPSPGRRVKESQDLPNSWDTRHLILTKSPAMKRILDQARSVAPSKATVLIQGESGTGKELLARYIHRHSDRSKGPFVALNCAALPETLLESELFGHEKGAFSGAIARKPGRFELANRGTLLLDEVTEMALPLQAKLLRVLQEGEVDRLGSTATIQVDVRVVATTNRDVLAAVRSGKFREDLYFRLNVIPLKLPPLRERQEDIQLLAEHFREKFTSEYGKKGLNFAAGVLDELMRRPWPGNVRELKNVIERGVLLSQDGEITLKDLFVEQWDQEGISHSDEGSAFLGKEMFNLSDIEREMVKRALAKTNGNRTHAARLLGISVRTLRNKLAEYRQMGLVL